MDLECGEQDVKLSSEARCYVVIDTNVALHHVCLSYCSSGDLDGVQIDLLEHAGMEDVIVPSIVLQEVDNSVFERIDMHCSRYVIGIRASMID